MIRSHPGGESSGRFIPFPFLFQATSTKPMLEQIIGKKSSALSEEQFLALRSSHEDAWIDLGTGDGMFVLRMARQQPQVLVVGMDADRDSLAIGSAKARKKPVSGGAPNALYLCANLSKPLPEVFQGRFSRVFINFPWGTLLKAVVEADEALLSGVRSLMTTQSRLEIALNMFVLNNSAQRETLQLPDFEPERVEQEVLPRFLQHGFQWLETRHLGREVADLVPSSWSGRLAKASGRASLHMIFEAI